MLEKIALGVAAISAATSGGFSDTQTEQMRTIQFEHTPRMEVRHEMRDDSMEAIATNNFEAWRVAVTSDEHNPMAAFATEDVFAQMVDIHTIMKSGDVAAARQAQHTLMTTLGIERPPQHEFRGKEGRTKPMHPIFDATTHASLEQAIADNNFDAWAAILLEADVPDEHISEEQFTRMVTHYQHRQEK